MKSYGRMFQIILPLKVFSLVGAHYCTVNIAIDVGCNFVHSTLGILVLMHIPSVSEIVLTTILLKLQGARI